MSRITKAIAEEIVIALLKKKKEKLTMMLEALAIMVSDYYKTQIPKDVLAIYKKEGCKNYIKTLSSLYLSGEGLNHDYVYLQEPVPSTQEYSHALQIDDPKVAENVSKLLSEHKKLYTETRNLEEELYVTIMAIRTQKRLEDEFPEAAEHFPKVGPPANIVKNIAVLRSKLL